MASGQPDYYTVSDLNSITLKRIASTVIRDIYADQKVEADEQCYLTEGEIGIIKNSFTVEGTFYNFGELIIFKE